MIVRLRVRVEVVVNDSNDGSVRFGTAYLDSLVTLFTAFGSQGTGYQSCEPLSNQINGSLLRLLPKTTLNIPTARIDKLPVAKHFETRILLLWYRLSQQFSGAYRRLVDGYQVSRYLCQH
jgi:hypothetical protein